MYRIPPSIGMYSPLALEQIASGGSKKIRAEVKDPDTGTRTKLLLIASQVASQEGNQAKAQENPFLTEIEKDLNSSEMSPGTQAWYLGRVIWAVFDGKNQKDVDQYVTQALKALKEKPSGDYAQRAWAYGYLLCYFALADKKLYAEYCPIGLQAIADIPTTDHPENCIWAQIYHPRAATLANDSEYYLASLTEIEKIGRAALNSLAEVIEETNATKPKDSKEIEPAAIIAALEIIERGDGRVWAAAELYYAVAQYGFNMGISKMDDPLAKALATYVHKEIVQTKTAAENNLGMKLWLMLARQVCIFADGLMSAPRLASANTDNRTTQVDPGPSWNPSSTKVTAKAGELPKFKQKIEDDKDVSTAVELPSEITLDSLKAHILSMLPTSNS